MMNGQQYKDSLRKLHPLIYCNGRKIENVVDDPMTAPHVNSAALTYELAFDPEYEDLMTATSNFTGKKINRFTHVHQSTEDLVKKVKMMRMIGQKTGTCFQRCVGFDAMNASFITTYKIDKKYGTNYHERLKKYMEYVQETDIMVAGSMTDPKGDRRKMPSQQADPDLFVHIVERREDGIVVRGAKAHQTGMVNSHEMLILPTTNLGPDDKDYAVAAAIPVDAPGVIHFFGRQTNENRRLEGDIDCGNPEYAIVGGETLTVLNDVFVPWDRVFMCGETDLAQEFVETFASYHRQNYGGCKVGVADVIIGAAASMAEYNGCPKASHIKDKLVEMVHLVETMHCCSIACSAMGHKTEDRIRMARLLENMTGGTALAESMHGAGSPQAMRVMIQRQTNWEQKKNFAKKLAKIEG